MRCKTSRGCRRSPGPVFHRGPGWMGGSSIRPPVIRRPTAHTRATRTRHDWRRGRTNKLSRAVLRRARPPNGGAARVPADPRSSLQNVGNPGETRSERVWQYVGRRAAQQARPGPQRSSGGTARPRSRGHSSRRNRFHPARKMPSHGVASDVVRRCSHRLSVGRGRIVPAETSATVFARRSLGREPRRRSLTLLRRARIPWTGELRDSRRDVDGLALERSEGLVRSDSCRPSMTA